MTSITQSPNALLALKGHPATGKSTLAQALVRTWGWPLLDKNDCWCYPIQPEHHLSVDTSQPLAQIVQRIEARLARQDV